MKKRTFIILASAFSGVILGFAIWLACLLSLYCLNNDTGLASRTQPAQEHVLPIDY